MSPHHSRRNLVLGETRGPFVPRDGLESRGQPAAGWRGRGNLCLLGLSLVALVCWASTAQATIYRVGPSSDSACDFNSMALALFATALTPGSDEIRVSRLYQHNGSVITVSNQSVTIDGRYGNCSDTPSSTTAVLDGAGSGVGPTVRVNCSGASCTVTLRNLSIEGGEDSDLDISGQSTVFLDDALVGFSASPGNGGAVRIDGTAGAHLVVTGISLIGNATAAGDGGGIWCSGRPAASRAVEGKTPDGEIIAINDEIEFLDGLLANGNATNGGGAFLTQGCRMNYAPASTFAGIIGNIATAKGGAFAVTGGATLHFKGNGSAPATVQNNTAVDGGGLYVEGESSQAIAINTQVIDNHASAHGAGIMLDNGGMASMNASAPTCTYSHCSSLSNNTDSGTLLSGGGAYVQRHSILSLMATHVLGNRAKYGSGIHVVAIDLGSTIVVPEVLLGSSIVANNEGSLDVILASRSSVLIDGSTFTGNRSNVTGLSLRSVLYSSDNLYGSMPLGGNITVTRSVFDNPEGVFAERAAGSNPGVINAQCLIANAVGNVSLPPGGAVETNFLIDPAHGDWRPRANSVAIDRCAATGALALTTDIALNPRGIDDPAVIDSAGTYDAGALESVSDVLFKDGFELSGSAF